MRRKFSVGQVLGHEKYFVFDEESGFIVRFGLSVEEAASLAEVLTGEIKREVKKKDFTIEDIFETVYSVYPRKLGRASGAEYLFRTIKNRAELLLCAMASAEYAARCQRDGTEEQFIKHFSTWVKKWRDDLPQELRPIIDTDEPTFL